MSFLEQNSRFSCSKNLTSLFFIFFSFKISMFFLPHFINWIIRKISIMNQTKLKSERTSRISPMQIMVSPPTTCTMKEGMMEGVKEFCRSQTYFMVLNVLSRGTVGSENQCRSSLVMGSGSSMGLMRSVRKEQKDELHSFICIIYKQIIKIQIMSYAPLEVEETTKQIAKHRNPVYPGLKYPKPQLTHTLQSEITSSLFFQQLIYYNYYYSFLFFYLYTASQAHRFIYFNMEFGVPVRVIVQILFLVLEVCRLQNAFHGNLRESFPEICAFIMMTFLTIAAQGILLSSLVPQSPLEWTLLFYGIIFHILELITCICTMGRLAQTQKALFLWRTPTTQTGGHK